MPVRAGSRGPHRRSRVRPGHPAGRPSGRVPGAPRGSASGRRVARHRPPRVPAPMPPAAPRRPAARARRSAAMRFASASARSCSGSATVSLTSRPKGGDPNRRRRSSSASTNGPSVPVRDRPDGRVVRQVGLDDGVPWLDRHDRRVRRPGPAAARCAPRRARRGASGRRPRTRRPPASPRARRGPWSRGWCPPGRRCDRRPGHR